MRLHFKRMTGHVLCELQFSGFPEKPSLNISEWKKFIGTKWRPKKWWRGSDFASVRTLGQTRIRKIQKRIWVGEPVPYFPGSSGHSFRSWRRLPGGRSRNRTSRVRKVDPRKWAAGRCRWRHNFCGHPDPENYTSYFFWARICQITANLVSPPVANDTNSWMHLEKIRDIMAQRLRSHFPIGQPGFESLLRFVCGCPQKPKKLFTRICQSQNFSVLAHSKKILFIKQI